MGATPEWLVYACRTDFVADVLAIIERRGEVAAALVDNLEDEPPLEDPAVVRRSALTPALLALPTVIPLITPGHRHQVVAEARERGVRSFPSLVDPTAIVPTSSPVGEGSVLNAAVVLGGEVEVGSFVHVNRSASVGHHSHLHDLTTVGPGAVLAGRVEVRRGAFVGAGAVCAPKVRIGVNAVVGAGAVVVKDVPDGAVVVGNPATVLRRSDTGYGGARVP